jgi:hypothetical protein
VAALVTFERKIFDMPDLSLAVMADTTLITELTTAVISYPYHRSEQNCDFRKVSQVAMVLLTGMV